MVEELRGLGSEAAACCVHAGMADRAVELFEQGHGLLLSQALDTRSDVTALEKLYPDLAARFTARRDEFDRVDDGGPVREKDVTAENAESDAVSQLARRSEAAEALDRVIAEVQAKPGFDRFLRTSPASELVQAAADGPIIIVNASSLGSHALILTSGGVAEPLPLAGLSLETLYERVPGFLTAVDDTSSPLVSSRTAAEQRITETLGWLWDEVAAPVLHRLGITAHQAKASPGRACGGMRPGCYRSCRSTPLVTTARGSRPCPPP